MSRAPTYSKDKQTRVISAPNDLWQLQQYDGTTGSRERDPWFNRGPTRADRDEAMAGLGPLI